MVEKSVEGEDENSGENDYEAVKETKGPAGKT
jgi:hypothetical protein